MRRSDIREEKLKNPHGLVARAGDLINVQIDSEFQAAIRSISIDRR